MPIQSKLPYSQEWFINRMERVNIETAEGMCCGVVLKSIPAILNSDLPSFISIFQRINAIPLNEFKNKSLDDADILPFLEDISTLQWLQVERSNATMAVLNNLDIAVADAFTSLLDYNHLLGYLNSLDEALKSSSLHEPVAISISGNQHIIALGYEPQKNTWCLIDANQLSIEELPFAHLQDTIVQALSLNNALCIATKIYTKSFYLNEVNHFAQAWRAHSKWQEIHAMTPEKALAIDSSGITWLQMASKEEDIVHLESLIKLGADINADRESPPLHLAVLEGHTRAVEILLRNGANQNITFSHGYTPIFYLIECGYADILKIFLDNQCDPNQKSYFNYTLLHKATFFGRINMVQMLLEYGAAVEPVTSDQMTPLFFAIDNGDAEMVKLLLLYGANPNKACNNVTPLQLATKVNHSQIIDILKIALRQSEINTPIKERVFAKWDKNSFFAVKNNNRSEKEEIEESIQVTKAFN